jgi:hypothetical protein
MIDIVTTISVVAVGLFFFVYGILAASHRPFQDWLYTKQTGLKPDKESPKYISVISHMIISGSGAALAAFLLTTMFLSAKGLW